LSRFLALASGGGGALGRFDGAGLRSDMRALAARTSVLAVRPNFFVSIPNGPPVRALVAPLVGQYHQALWV
jgi:hypothetical protein